MTLISPYFVHHCPEVHIFLIEWPLFSLITYVLVVFLLYLDDGLHVTHRAPAEDTLLWHNFQTHTEPQFQFTPYRYKVIVNIIVASEYNDWNSFADVMVEKFSESDSNLFLEKLCFEYAAELSREACLSPCSLVVALIYLERLCQNNPNFVSSIPSSKLFLISVVKCFATSTNIQACLAKIRVVFSCLDGGVQIFA